ncbi:MAG: TonB-dependent receptor [Ignavibacteria bacterium]|nr:TonB-dependent receptor [Ignavibacteria bacterium]
MKIYKFILLIIFISNTLLYSQYEGKDTTILQYIYPIDIVVSAQRINAPLKDLPLSVSIINKDILNATLNKRVCTDEAFKLVPGVKVDNQAGGNRIHLSMRGQGILSERGIRGIRTLLDNIPLNDPAGFTPDLYDVDWATLNKIEIIRGPSASLFGASASGGIINISTKDGYEKPLGGEFLLSYGKFNSWKALGQFGATVNNINYRVSFSRYMGDGYRVHTHYWGNNVYGKLNYYPTKDIKLTPVLFYTESYSENAEGLNLTQVNENPQQANPDAVPKHEYLYTQRFTSGISGDIGFGNNYGINFYGFIKGYKFQEAVPSSVLHRYYLIPGGALQFNVLLGNKNIKHNISVGTEFQTQNIDEKRYPNLGAAREDFSTLLSNETIFQSGVGTYLIYRIGLFDKWSIMLNGRYDYVYYKLDDKLKNPRDLSDTRNYDRITGRVGISYTPLPNLNIYADFGQGFTPPSIEELANNPKSFGGFNPDLTYAKSNGFEFGVRGDVFSKKFNYEATFFYLKTDNDFNRFRIPGRPLETFYRNTDSLGNSLGSERFGSEIYFRLRPIEQVTFQVAYTYSNFKYRVKVPERIIMDDTTIFKYIEDGKFLPNSPEHQAYIDLQYNIIPELYVGISAEVYSRSYIDGANILAESVPGFVLYNARAGYNFNIYGYELETSIFVKNIFSRRWIAFTEPDPGGNSYQPGTPIEVFGTLIFKFK